jgi:hypothetical protein
VKRLLASLLLTLALGACSGDDDPTGPEEDVFEGRYNLVTVDGDSVPAVFQGDSATVTVVSGYFNLNLDETFTYAFTIRVVENGVTTTESPGGLGLWARNNDAVYFVYADESFPDAATIANGHMYMTSGLSVYVFRKQ